MPPATGILVTPHDLIFRINPNPDLREVSRGQSPREINRSERDRPRPFSQGAHWNAWHQTERDQSSQTVIYALQFRVSFSLQIRRMMLLYLCSSMPNKVERAAYWIGIMTSEPGINPEV